MPKTKTSNRIMHANFCKNDHLHLLSCAIFQWWMVLAMWGRQWWGLDCDSARWESGPGPGIIPGPGGTANIWPQNGKQHNKFSIRVWRVRIWWILNVPGFANCLRRSRTTWIYYPFSNSQPKRRILTYYLCRFFRNREKTKTDIFWRILTYFDGLGA